MLDEMNQYVWPSCMILELQQHNHLDLDDMLQGRNGTACDLDVIPLTVIVL